MIFFSVDDLISTFWFASRKQFYSISQVSRQWAQLSETFLDRYPQKDVDPLVIRAAVGANSIDGQNEAGLENKQIGGNQLFIERWNSKGESRGEPAEEIPFAPKMHAYPKVGKISYISIKAPLRNNALEFLQGCCSHHNFNGHRFLHFAGHSFDIFAKTHEPREFGTFATICNDFRIKFGELPENLEKFGEFLGISKCRTIDIGHLCANLVEPFVEWLIQNPLPQLFVKINGHENPLPDFPSFHFDNFPSNAPKIIATKCRQVFNDARKRQQPQSADGNNAAEKTPQMPYCYLSFGQMLPENYRRDAQQAKFQMRNSQTGDEFRYRKQGTFTYLQCKPGGQLPQFARRATRRTTICVALEADGDNEVEANKWKEIAEERKMLRIRQWLNSNM